MLFPFPSANPQSSRRRCQKAFIVLLLCRPKQFYYKYKYKIKNTYSNTKYKYMEDISEVFYHLAIQNYITIFFGEFQKIYCWPLKLLQKYLELFFLAFIKLQGHSMWSFRSPAIFFCSKYWLWSILDWENNVKHNFYISFWRLMVSYEGKFSIGSIALEIDQPTTQV